MPLTFIEKTQLEKAFGMASGYVLGFSNYSFHAFIADSVGKDIDDEKYENSTNSKAKRLRKFWDVEADHVLGKLTKDMLAYAQTLEYFQGDEPLLAECTQIADRLLQGATVEELDAITPNAPGRCFEACAKAARESIEKNEPEVGLDRLHTFMMKYVRTLCEKHGILVDRDKPLNAIVGEYVKCVRAKGKLDAEMTDLILRSSISILDRFNYVRNNKSLAHDNEILNYHESLLIFNNVAASVRFLEAIESEAPPEQVLAAQPCVPDLFSEFGV